jgi:hypothetical protein
MGWTKCECCGGDLTICMCSECDECSQCVECDGHADFCSRYTED